MSGEPGPNQISLDQLSVEQLTQVKQQLDEELNHLTTGFQSLKTAQAKFQASMDALDAIKPVNKDKKILIPLTSSLYVPGKLSDTENVIVDVGTGYYVEKSTKSAKTLYNGKILSLKSSLATLQSQLERKTENANVVLEMLRIKMSAAERGEGEAETG